MKTRNKMLFIPLLLILFLVAMMVTSPMGSMANQHTVELGTAKSFAILAGTGITNTGPTWIEGTAGGDVGLSPAAGSFITGLTTDHVDGTIYTVDATGHDDSVMDPDLLTTAKNDLVTAYDDAAGRASDETIAADLAGQTLTPGVYNSGSSIALAVDGTLTLDGQNDPNAVFIFQAGSTLTTGSGSNIVLTNGAQPCRVFWQIGSSATLGTNSTFVGHILALTSITANNGAEVEGQLLARDGAVTLENNTITNDVCLSTVPTGSLTVGKTVSGDTGETELPLFEITVTGPEGFSETRTFVSGDTYTWENLVPGTYTVTEDKTGLSDEWTVTGEGDVEVVEDQTSATTVTNSYVLEEDVIEEVSYGSLTVGKTVSGDTAGMTLPPFEITVTGPDGFSATRTFVSGETFTWENLVPGTYTVTEDKTGLSEEWTVTGEGNVEVVADETAVTTVTNSYLAEEVSYGSLTVDTIVSGDTAGISLPEFDITVTGPENFSATRTFASGETFTWENLVPGTYTVTEDKAGLSEEWTVTGEGSVQVVAGQTTVVTVTNSYLAEEETELPRTGGNELLLFISGISMALVGGFFLKGYRRK